MSLSARGVSLLIPWTTMFTSILEDLEDPAQVDIHNFLQLGCVSGESPFP